MEEKEKERRVKEGEKRQGVVNEGWSPSLKRQAGDSRIMWEV